MVDEDELKGLEEEEDIDKKDKIKVDDEEEEPLDDDFLDDDFLDPEDEEGLGGEIGEDEIWDGGFGEQTEE